MSVGQESSSLSSLTFFVECMNVLQDVEVMGFPRTAIKKRDVYNSFFGTCRF